MDADIIVTGRTADSALALAPLVHEFNWSLEKDWDKLSSGSLAGHLIECGGQATGGLYTDWEDVDGYENLGFPVAQVSENGDILVTKPEKTGGLLNRNTVSEQMLYEIGDPSSYILPDVVCDFTQVQMKDTPEGVLVTGAKGRPATDSFKVCSTYLDGFKATAVAVVAGGRAAGKARKTADAIMKRTNGLLKKLGLEEFSRTHISIIGAEDVFGKNRQTNISAREAVIWMSVAHSNPEAINVWAREIASSGTGMTPGLCGMVGGRPKPIPCLKLYSFLYPKEKLPGTVQIGEKKENFKAFVPSNQSCERTVETKSKENLTLKQGSNTFRLEELAFSRSGDKGNSCNIGVIARDPAYLPYIKDRLTEERVFEYFEHLFGPNGKVTRFDLPGIDALNFLLEDVLDGGGIASMRPDPLGKAFGQILLDIPLNNMPSLEEILS